MSDDEQTPEIEPITPEELYEGLGEIGGGEQNHSGAVPLRVMSWADGYWKDLRTWLLDHPDHPAAPQRDCFDSAHLHAVSLDVRTDEKVRVTDAEWHYILEDGTTEVGP